MNKVAYQILPAAAVLAASLLVTACDSDGPPVIINPNIAPTANSEFFEADSNATFSGAFLRGADANGDRMQFQVSSEPSNGTVTLATGTACGDNSRCPFSYTPNVDYIGTDQFSFTVFDGEFTSVPGTVVISVVDAGNQNSPQADEGEFNTNEDTVLNEALVASDPDGDPIVFSLVAGSGPDNGTLTLENDGTFSYDPDRDFLGDDTFQYRVDDDTGRFTVANVTITVACENSDAGGRCDWDKAPLVDDASFSGAGEPSIGIDTLLRANVAFVEDATSASGGTQDLFVYQLDYTIPGSNWTQLPSTGQNGSLNSNGTPASTPDVFVSTAPPTGVGVAWAEGRDIEVRLRTDLGGTWDDVSGNPNDTATNTAADPAITLDAITGSPVIAWTETTGTNGSTDVPLATNSGFGLLNPGNWVNQGALDIDADNNSSRVAIAADDVPGTGANVNGRLTVGFTEVVGGVSQVFVRQCTAPASGASGCTQLGAGPVNRQATDNASEISLTVPNLAAAGVIGESPTNPRPVAAFVEEGRLFVSRYDVDNGVWLALNDPTNVGSFGELNVETTATAANPAIVVDVLGRYTVVWSETSATDGVERIYAKRYTAADSWTQLGRILNCDPDANATNPDITVDTVGVPYIVFQEDEAGDSRIVVLRFQD